MAQSNVAPRAFANVLRGIYDGAISPSPGLGPRLALGAVYLLLVLPSALIVAQLF